jgi:effector-binding domain-containing protein
VQSKNRLPTGIAYEFYYNSPMEVKPEQLLTQVMFVLQD